LTSFQSLSSMEYAELPILPEVSIHSAVLQCSRDSLQSDFSLIDTGLVLFIFESWQHSAIIGDPVLADVIPILYAET